MAGERQSLGSLNLEEVFADIVTRWGNVNEAWDDGDYDAVVVNLINIAERIGDVSPQVASVISELVEAYGATAKPLIDRLVVPGTKAAAYFYETAAATKQNLIPHMEKYATVNAQIRAMNLGALRKAGFSRREAMDIILAEISGARSSQKSWREFFSKLPSVTRTERKGMDFRGI